jgi:hypothetical protein
MLKQSSRHLNTFRKSHCMHTMLHMCDIFACFPRHNPRYFNTLYFRKMLPWPLKRLTPQIGTLLTFGTFAELS